MVTFVVCFSLWLLMANVEGTSLPCALRDYGEERRVCVCNATYCDTIERVPHINSGEFVSFKTSRDGLRLNKTIRKFSNTTESPGLFPFTFLSSLISTVTFTVNTKMKYQKMMGFGGAFTDSAGINILSLSKQTQEHLLRSYFSEHGIEYNLCRLPISGTDFSTHPYSYDDGPPDPKLEYFSLAKEDLKYKIPLIKRAIDMSERDIHLVAASWSPPPWMKTNNDFSGVSSLKEEYYDVYAKYLLKFLEEYKKNSVNIWAISTGNEPSNGIIPVNKFNSLGWVPSTISNWTTNFFGPQLRRSLFNNTILLAFDDQRLFLPWWIELMVKADKNVLKYVDGFAIHWYWDFLIGPGVINDLHTKYPDKTILYTEACLGDKPWEKKVDFGSWDRGERYIADIIQNINTWVSSWMDWNLALDMTGGPTWARNFVDSPILVNAMADEFYKQPMFYAMAHVSKFIERGAVRIALTLSDTSTVQATAVENPDGRIVIVMLNTNSRNIKLSISVPQRGWINEELPPHSFATIIC